MPDPAPTTPTPTPAPAPAPTDPSPLGGAPAPAEPAAEPVVEEPKAPTDPLYKEPEEEPAADEPKEPKDPAAEPVAKVINPAVDYKDLALPEGFEPDEAQLTTFKTLAAKAGVPAEGAQELLTLGAQQVKAAVEKASTDATKLWDDTITQWKADVAADPDIGGAKFKPALETIGRALDEYGSLEARQAFDVTGAGWNPAIVKFVHKMAAALSEGKPLPAPKPAPKSGTTIGNTLYPDPS